MTGPAAKGPVTPLTQTELLLKAVTGQCWYMRSEVEGLVVDWLVDSGANPNVLDKSVYDRIPDPVRPRLVPTPIKLGAADGRPLTVHGECTLTLQAGGRSYGLQVFVAELGGLDGLLGMGFLRQERCRLDAGQGILEVNDDLVMLHQPGNGQYHPIRLTKSVQIAPNHEIIVEGQLAVSGPVPSQGMVEVEPSLISDTGLLVMNGLVRTVGRCVPVILTNVGLEPITLKEGTTIANIQPIDQVLDTLGGKPAAPVESNVLAVQGQGGLPEHLQDLVDNSSEHLSDPQIEQLSQLLLKYKGAFMGPDGKLGRTDLIKHHIDTGSSRPIKQALRRTPLAQREAAEAELNDMLEKGIIEPSDSPWASPVVLVKKKGGSLRYCVDFRKVNELTRKDAYPLPNISDCLDALQGAQWFSTLDCASGYWQVEMDAESKPKTAFSTPQGLYQFRVMPFGLTNAPATFERLMELVLRGLQWKRCLLYLDDVIVVGKSFEDALVNLAEVFDRLQEAGLKLKPPKCKLLQKSVVFLGHLLKPEGRTCDPDKTAAVVDWEAPKDVSQVRSFLGFASYYRCYVPGFATIASPLHQLTRHGEPFVWTEECEQAFSTLKEKLVQPPVLAHPSLDPADHFVLDTDASNVGMGGVLSQIQGGQERVINFASKVLSSTQAKYCTTYKELLAVVTFVKQFRHYLLGRKFTVRTDHSSLRWLLNFKDLDGMVGRWVMYLSTFDMVIEHRKGVLHGNADGLSRKFIGRKRKCVRESCPDCSVGEEVAESVLPESQGSEAGVQDSGDTGLETEVANGTEGAKGHTKNRGQEGVKALETKGEAGVNMRKDTDRLQHVPVNEPSTDPDPILSNWSEVLSTAELAEMQTKDVAVGKVLSWVEEGRPTPNKEDLLAESELVRRLCSQWPHLVIENGLLYRKHHRTNDVVYQLVAPQELRTLIFNQLHASRTGGHLGVTRTVVSVKSRFYWPGCKEDVSRWVAECPQCAMVKPAPRKGVLLKQSPVGAPLDRAAIDILGELPETENGNKYILVFVDYFTKWTQAFALPDQRAQTVADVLVNQVFTTIGVPHQLHSDQGRNFESDLFAELCKLLGVNKTRTTPFRPQSDGMVERFNRTIQQMLKTFVNENRDDWDDHLPYLTMAYRATVHDSTGCTPNQLMLGREANLPLDIMMGPPPRGQDKYRCAVEYVEWVRQATMGAYERAHSTLKKTARRQKRNYDVRVQQTEYKVGDFVWRWYPPKARGKLGCGWTGPYQVVMCPNPQHCMLQDKNRGGPFRVHRDLLQPYHGKPPDWEEAEHHAFSSSEEEGSGSEEEWDLDPVDSGQAPEEPEPPDITSDVPDPDLSSPEIGDLGPRKSGRARRPVQRMDL